VRYYDWADRRLPELGPDDLLVGHPNYDPDTVIQRGFREGRCRAKILLFPLHTGLPEYNLPFDHLVHQADRVLSITGPHWYNTLHLTRFAAWKPKIVRLDMAVRAEHFPRFKHGFNPPGKRRLLFLGAARPEKNLEQLEGLLRARPDWGLDWYGGYPEHPLSYLPNVTVHPWCDMTDQTAREAAGRCDILVSTSRSDANPTTLLEAVCWGLVPACTRQSGYDGSEGLFDILPLDDVPGTIEVLERLQREPEPALLERMRLARRVVEVRYNWGRFGDTVWSVLRDYL